MFKSGYVNIIGKPNAGKSTLMNTLVGEKLAIITPKAQTTRKRILGIVNGENFQIVFSDTPGIVNNPDYKLHHWMNEQIKTALKDADIILYITTPDEMIPNGLSESEMAATNFVIEKLQKINTPVIVLINKIDMLKKELIPGMIEKWLEVLPGKTILPISALNKMNLDQLQSKFLELLPVHPPYFDSDALTDQPERFFVAEIIREKILKNYTQEIPYSAEVGIDEYKEKEDIIVIRAVIYVLRETHKMIIIGNGGSAIKKLGIDARKDIEAWLEKKVFLELFVKIKDNWKDDERSLKEFGYH